MNFFRSFSEAILYRLDEGYKEVKIRFLKDGAKLDEIEKLLNFHKSLKDMRRLPNQDLNIDVLAKGKTFEELKDYLSKYSVKDLQTKTDLWANLKNKIVGQDSNYTVYQIDSVEEAWLFHGKVKWCISSGTTIKDAEKYWNIYTNGHTEKHINPARFYVAIGNNIEYPYNYLAIQVFEEGENPQFTVWDARDKGFIFKTFESMCSYFKLPEFKFEYKKVEFLFTDYFEELPNGKYNCIKYINKKILKHFIKNGKFTLNFNIAKDDFDCSECGLISLEGAPEKVNGFFDCADNKLTSLKGAPKEVTGFFNCSKNQLTTLGYGPKKVGRGFNCSYNKLTSLKGAPEYLNKGFNCADNKLTTLKGGPKQVLMGFDCHENKLKTLEGAPKLVGDFFNCSNNQLTSLEGAPVFVGSFFDCSFNKLSSPQGIPKNIGGGFRSDNNKKLFNVSEIKALSKIDGSIWTGKAN